MDVVIVDDSELIRECLRDVASGVPNCRIVGEAGEVKEALAMISRLKPRIVLLDVQLPGGSGLDVLREVKGWPSPPVVIMMTVFGSPDVRRQCRQLGADLFVEKWKGFTAIQNVLRRLSRPRTRTR